ncbi:MAG: hypothetical protein AAFY53_01085 [Pseudomonadota bacterium]
MLLFVAVPAAHPSQAYGEPEICQRAKALGYDESKELRSFSNKKEHCITRFWGLYRPKPLAQVFDASAMSEYDRATERGDCKGATKLLSQHFDAAHPDAPSHRADEWHFFNWRIAMERHFYPTLGLCRDLSGISNALKRISDANIEYRPFWSRKENFYYSVKGFPLPVQSLYTRVGSLLNNLGRTRSPKVALALLKLSDTGKAIRLHAHYELYIAYRLRDLGVEDPLVDKIIIRAIKPGIRTTIADKAKRKEQSGIPMFPNP